MGSIELQDSIQSFCTMNAYSDKESEVFNILASGKAAAKDISMVLGISPNTAKIHISKINKKTQSGSKAEVLGKFIKYISCQQISETK